MTSVYAMFHPDQSYSDADRTDVSVQLPPLYLTSYTRNNWCILIPSQFANGADVGRCTKYVPKTWNGAARSLLPRVHSFPDPCVSYSHLLKHGKHPNIHKYSLRVTVAIMESNRLMLLTDMIPLYNMRSTRNMYERQRFQC